MHRRPVPAPFRDEYLIMAPACRFFCVAAVMPGFGRAFRGAGELREAMSAQLHPEILPVVLILILIWPVATG